LLPFGQSAVTLIFAEPMALGLPLQLLVRRTASGGEKSMPTFNVANETQINGAIAAFDTATVAGVTRSTSPPRSPRAPTVAGCRLIFMRSTT
jgi:hypothetical protein